MPNQEKKIFCSFRLSAEVLGELEALAWFALSTLCGLRPQEAEKTVKADINFKERYVRVEAQTTKVRQRRIVYPKPEAIKFLKWAIKHGGTLPLDPQIRQRIIAGVSWKNKDGVQRRPGLRHALGFKVWPKDITRHTAASYWLASDVSTAHVAEMLGNSEKILKSHYKALVTREQAKEFWEMAAKVRF
jgi:integrase